MSQYTTWSAIVHQLHSEELSYMCIMAKLKANKSVTK